MVDYALLLICVILFNLNAWMHNYILLAMPYFIIAYYLVKGRFKDGFVLSLLILSFSLNLATNQGILGEKWAYKVYFYSPFTVSALLTFIALLKIKFSRNLAKSPF